MRQVANTLPNPEQSSFEARCPSIHSNTSPSASMMVPASSQDLQPMPQYGHQRRFPERLARSQQPQQHYLPQHFLPQHAQFRLGNRPQPPQMQTRPLSARTETYAYGTNQSGHSSIDMTFTVHHFPMGYNAPGGYADIPQCARSTSEPVAVPSIPRGPPRKPKQSGHALWVGNLPPAASVTDLKDHFSRDATSDIQSLFLISKSNCAFVNYRSESACVAALNRFHDSRYQGVRLVCRLRRGSTCTSNASAIAESPKPPVNPNLAPKGLNNGVAMDEPSYPIIVDSAPAIPGRTDTQTISSDPALAVMTIPDKFFIVKSLTLQDLEASVRNGIWATQSHNESTLNQAFNAANNVYLIFSANRSGEYFGYARMVSPVASGTVPAGSAPIFQLPTPSDGPKSIPTPATETAPRGRVIDDSARGTIFWETVLADEESASPHKELEEEKGGRDLGRFFQIEWISTARLPFYRTRGLRNPWNASREVKIARDGTEIEPSIGKRLVQMFHQPARMGALPNITQPYGMPY